MRNSYTIQLDDLDLFQLLDGLEIRAEWTRTSNRNAIASLSPGLRAARYPGLHRQNGHNPVRVESSAPAKLVMQTLAGLWFNGSSTQRSRLARQRWAEGWNPFRIREPVHHHQGSPANGGAAMSQKRRRAEINCSQN